MNDSLMEACRRRFDYKELGQGVPLEVKVLDHVSWEAQVQSRSLNTYACLSFSCEEKCSNSSLTRSDAEV